MTCRQARKAIPLLARGDIGGRRAEKVLAHIASCGSCRGEFEAYRSSIERARSAGSVGEIKGWSEAEWHALMARITATGLPRKRRLLGLRPQWALAWGLAAAALLTASALVFKTTLFRGNSRATGAGPVLITTNLPPAKSLPAPFLPGPVNGPWPAQAPYKIFDAEAIARKAPSASGAPTVTAPPGPALSQDVVSVTLVSQETGLQVVWFFNRNFEWKGDKK